ncbi:MAG TPA: histidine kinase dimerization/phosphoacceptor domain -containing protein, partial [Acidobacteriota bacterium]|nr:histidine kinase dimerization/phosphoacceptor domain -containing protein [Acidobacteriota bacterium]
MPDTAEGKIFRLFSTANLPRHLSGLIIVFAAGVVTLLWLVVGLLVRQERTDVIERVKKEDANLARAYAEHTLRSLDYVDQLTFLIRAQYEKLGKQFDLPRYFEENQVDGKLVINSVITDASGLTILSSQRGFTPANLADREHVKVHLERDRGKIFLGKPVFARVAKRWSFVATRRINNPDGSYGGVVGVAVDPFYFSQFYKRADLGKDSLVALTGTDGIVRARIMGDDQSVGQDVSKGTVFKAFSSADSGTMTAISMIDGLRRIYAFHRVQDFPLFITVGTSEPAALAPVDARHRYYVIMATIVSVLLLATASGLAALLRYQQRAAEETLGENREQLRQHNEMLTVVSEAQASYLARGDWKAATAWLLQFALKQSSSEYGFFGVVVNGPKLRILAHQGVVWDQFEGHEIYQGALMQFQEQGYWEFTSFDNLFGAAVGSGRSVIANDVASDPRSSGRPAGHPAMHSFLGLPIRTGDKVIGVLGLANRPAGYEPAVVAALERLVGFAEPVCASYLSGLEQEQLRVEQRLAEERLRASLAEKDALLKEVHHRVKNNLQVITSLLLLQASAIEDRRTREAFRESQDRVQAMALVHEQLYRSETLSHLDFGEHLRTLAGNVAYSYSPIKQGVRLDLNLTKVPVDLDTAIPLSLIFNELLSNAYKHGFPDNRPGRIEVTLTRNDDGLILRVSDDGVGLHEGVDWTNLSTLGLKIVRNLTEQIHGKIEVISGPGATF